MLINHENDGEYYPKCPYCEYEMKPTLFTCDNGSEYGWSCACIFIGEAEELPIDSSLT